MPTGPDAKNDSFPPHQRLGVEKVCLPTDSSAPIVPVNLALLSPWSEGQLESRRSSRAPPSSSLTVASECPRCGARPWLDVPPLASPTECEVCLWRSDSECTTGRGANGQGGYGLKQVGGSGEGWGDGDGGDVAQGRGTIAFSALFACSIMCGRVTLGDRIVVVALRLIVRFRKRRTMLLRVLVA